MVGSRLSRLLDEVVPLGDEIRQIAIEKEAVHGVAKQSKRRFVVDPVQHAGAIFCGLERVDVSPILERSGDLFIHESSRSLHLGYSRSHVELQSEVPSSPSDLFTELDKALGGAAYGLFR
jgi:hypothetical protein